MIPVKNDFIKKWILANLIGLLFGVFVGPILFYLVIALRIALPAGRFLAIANVDFFDIAPIFIWFPIGASLGIAQQRLLLSWNIRPIPWVIATSLGFAHSEMSSFAWQRYQDTTNYDGSIQDFMEDEVWK